MEEYANLLIAFISANGAAIGAFIINMIVIAVKQKKKPKENASYASIELQLLKIDARLAKLEQKEK